MWPFRKPKLCVRPDTPAGFYPLYAASDFRGDFIHSGDLVYNRATGRWYNVNHEDYRRFIGEKLEEDLVNTTLIFYRELPPAKITTLPEYRPGETPLGVHWTPAQEAELKRQKDIQQKMADGKANGDGEVRPLPGESGKCLMTPFGRYEEIQLTVADLDSGEARRILQHSPLFGRINVGWLPPETPTAVAVLYQHILAGMDVEDKQKLYAKGGVDAVRDVCLRVARQIVLDNASTLKVTHEQLQAATAQETQATLDGAAQAPGTDRGCPHEPPEPGNGA